MDRWGEEAYLREQSTSEWIYPPGRKSFRRMEEWAVPRRTGPILGWGRSSEDNPQNLPSHTTWTSHIWRLDAPNLGVLIRGRLSTRTQFSITAALQSKTHTGHCNALHLVNLTIK